LAVDLQINKKPGFIISIKYLREEVPGLLTQIWAIENNMNRTYLEKVFSGYSGKSKALFSS
jgi:hypothetical protein